ncbi:MAG: hypothetical protein FJ144_14060 [Deltaproteobacteria bacterium]|nr:hypothetical protein [Deltaproteobacteria bacterium]
MRHNEPDPLPAGLEGIEPAWLSAALAKRFPGARVRRVSVVDRHSGTTGRGRITVEYDERADAPESFFVKLPPENEAQRRFVQQLGFGESESRFYLEIRPELSLQAPDCYFAAWSNDGDGRFLLLLEDLVARGMALPRPRDPEVLDYARQVVTDLAGLHAAFWQSERFGTDLAWLRPPSRGGGNTNLIERAVELFGGDMHPDFTRLGEILSSDYAGVANALDDGAPTLVHGDAHMGNMFLIGSRIGFLDWAVLSRAPGMRDVSYFLCNSIPPDVRRANEKDLIDLYCGTLAEAGCRLDRNRAQAQYRLGAVYSWIAATTTAAMGSQWQKQTVGLAGMRRATESIVDLGTVDALRERLDRASRSK